MNRELKFRVWDYCARNFVDNGVGQYITECSWDGEVAYLQFTGLLDKNGKEIYEGDIVRYYQTEEDREGKIDFLGKIEYHHNGFWVFPIDEEYKKAYKFFQIETQAKSIKVEVIGNIFENGDLLK